MSDVKVVKEEPVPVPSNTMRPEDALPEEDRRKLKEMQEFDAARAAENIMTRWETFGRSKAERDKLWDAWAKMFKEDSNAVIKGMRPAERTDGGRTAQSNLEEVKDPKIRQEILKRWFEERYKKKFDQPDVI